MSKHTPGPWRLDGRLVTADGRSPASRLLVAEVHETYREVEEFHGNTSLIVAAPELLVAARGALRLLAAYQGDDPSETRSKLEAAIAKAEGA